MNIKLFPKIKNLLVWLPGGYSKHRLSLSLAPPADHSFALSCTDASVRLYLPPALDESEVTKYPLLIHVYGGPGSQQVNERFYVNWGHHLATSKNIIYGLIDGRGSGFKGEKMLHELYHRLGSVEVEDQIQVAK